MRRLIIGIITIIISTTIVHGQDKTKKDIALSVGVDAGFPFGSFLINNIYAFATGASLQAAYPLSHRLGLTLKAGYLNYLGREKYGFKNEVFIPVLTGLEYHLKNKIYFAGQLGIAFSTTNKSLTGGGVLFSYCAGIGYQFTKHISVLAKYEAVYKDNLTIGNIGFRAAYSF